jgi:hypothetical protein
MMIQFTFDLIKTLKTLMIVIKCLQKDTSDIYQVFEDTNDIYHQL